MPRRFNAASVVGKSGLQVPRFVSLKAGRVNVRVGPGEDYKIAWVFTRTGLPIEVIQEYDTWRRIRDSDGAVGWVFNSLLSGKRTAVVTPWSKGEPQPIHADATAECRDHRLSGAGRAEHDRPLPRRLVPDQRQGLRRLDRAGSPVGRLSQRGRRLAAVARPSIRAMIYCIGLTVRYEAALAGPIGPGQAGRRQPTMPAAGCGRRSPGRSGSSP